MNPTNPNPSDQNLPKVADMLETVRHEAAELRNFTITFLSLLLYVSLIVVATDHEQILRVSPVTLPLLSVDIPILGFYWFMPPFLFFMHLYILVQHYLFSQLAFRFQISLNCEIPEIQSNIRQSLGNLPFLHWLLGEHGFWMKNIMVFISVMSLVVWPVFMFWWMQARFLPYHDEGLVFWQQCWLTIDTFFLAYLWAKTLDESNDAWNWWKNFRILICYFIHEAHRRALDVIFPKWPPLASRASKTDALVWNKLKNGLPSAALVLFLLTAWFFSWMVSLVPESAQEKWLIEKLAWIDGVTIPDSNKTAASSDSIQASVFEKHWLLIDANSNVDIIKRMLFIPTFWLHEKLIVQGIDYDDLLKKYDPERIKELPCPSSNQGRDEEKCFLVDSLMPRNLVLRKRVLTEDKQLDPELAASLEVKKEPKMGYLNDYLNKISPLNLQGRNFDYADFSESSLPRVDLQRTSLKFANLSLSRLDGANLENTYLIGADLSSARFPGAKLERAKLYDVSLSMAYLPGADFSGAELLHVDLNFANLSGSNFSYAFLPGANLVGAQLAGTSFGAAQMQGANMREAQLQGAFLFMVELHGANLTGAKLAGADLTGTKLQGADISDSESDSESPETELDGAILNNIEYKGLSEADINYQIDTFRKRLLKAPFYQTEQGKAQLENDINDLRQRLSKDAIFPKIRSKSFCVSNIEEINNRRLCHAWYKVGNSQKDKILEFWTKLACDDASPKQWLAGKIADRALPSFDELTDWPGLALKLDQALQVPKNCPGLSALPDNQKKHIHQIAAISESKK